MVYAITLALLFVVELLYFHIAEKYRIIDKPNERSSHTRVTLRGGGIIYWVAALLYVVANPSQQSAWFFAGITVIAAISFWDDVKGTSQKIRLVFHLLAMTCAFLRQCIWRISVVGDCNRLCGFHGNCECL